DTYCTCGMFNIRFHQCRQFSKPACWCCRNMRQRIDDFPAVAQRCEPRQRAKLTLKRKHSVTHAPAFRTCLLILQLDALAFFYQPCVLRAAHIDAVAFFLEFVETRLQVGQSAPTTAELVE